MLLSPTPKEREEECKAAASKVVMNYLVEEGWEEDSENEDDKAVSKFLLFNLNKPNLLLLFGIWIGARQSFKTFQPYFDASFEDFTGLKMFSSSLFLSYEFIERSGASVRLLVQPKP